MHSLRYNYGGNVYRLLQKAGLDYLATDRLALDQLLGRNPEHIDVYMAYIDMPYAKMWKRHLSQNGAHQARFGPDLVLIPTKSFAALHGEHKGLVALETLAKDLKITAPRYRNARLQEIREKLPELYTLILKHSSPLSLGLEQTA